MRKSVAVLCMALAVMLSGQAYISLKDRMDHAHHHAHFANPLAGDVTMAVHDHHSAGHHHHDAKGAHGDGHHEHGTDFAADHPHQHSHAAGGHHHAPGPVDHVHGDAAVMFLAAQSFILVGCPMATELCESRPQDFASFSPRGPDHPPKSSFEIRV